MRLLTILGLGAIALTLACGRSQPRPPVAKIVPHTLREHGRTRVDDYYWLRDRSDPEVLAYLEAENRYTEAVMADTEALQERLYEEIVGRIEKDDSTVPYLLDGYYYYRRFASGREYPLFCRRQGSLEAPEEVMLDVNRLAEGHDYCDVGDLAVSPDGDLLAYAVDFAGRRKHTIRFKRLSSGELLPDALPEVTATLAWANDDQTLFYVRQDPETLRANQVLRHRLGEDHTDDVLVYEETDPTFSVSLAKTKSKRFVVVESEQTLSTEVRLLDADRPTAPSRLVEPRAVGLEYHVDHLGDHLYIRTNLDARDFRLVSAPLASPGREHWEEVVPGRDGILLESFELFRDVLVVRERRDGLSHLRVIPWSGSDEHEVDFDEAAYGAWIDVNPTLDTSTLRFGYSSPTTPDSIYDYDFETGERTLMKRDHIGGGYDPADYVAERLFAPARDGERIPITLVYRKGLERDGRSPLVLHGYGAYGITIDPYFAVERISLLDRGFIWATAHVRGGQELGRRWYEDGKLLHKKNSFNDFIDCARYLVDQGWTSPDRLFARGGSAGGLLVGAVANLAPELFAGIVAHVPWVDVVTTMLDPDVPLTTAEYDEWGNPEDPEYYEYMLAYSPYDNVRATAYPAMMITTGLNDSQVQYWEPAKWAAKLRALKTDDHLLILKTDMGSGHGGPSGRYAPYREDALEYAFMLQVIGRADDG